MHIHHLIIPNLHDKQHADTMPPGLDRGRAKRHFHCGPAAGSNAATGRTFEAANWRIKLNGGHEPARVTQAQAPFSRPPLPVSIFEGPCQKVQK